ncbi:MAG: PASTA domain-containing protein [Bacteroidota bacterium]|nr:PASTA domain-containing protein [Bacteroidota bacterium]
MFKFIARQSFFINLLVAIALIFLAGFIFFQSLGWITHHGEYLKVPSVTGKKVEDAVKLLENQGFEVVITDSLYNDSLPLNTVIKQLPGSDATVKVNRTVFLNVNPSTLPFVVMPKLEGLSFRFAVENLTKSNLKLGDTTYRPDFMKGSVLEQHYNGSRIPAGTKIRWGSSVDLIIGGGLEAQSIPVPNLKGLTVTEAKNVLQAQGILLAAILTTGNVTDTANAFIYKQNPDVLRFDKTPVYIQPGQTMDIWIQVDRPIVDSLSTISDSLNKKIK